MIEMRRSAMKKLVDGGRHIKILLQNTQICCLLQHMPHSLASVWVILKFSHASGSS